MKWQEDAEKWIKSRQEKHLLRTLPSQSINAVDLWSNDYLGLARDKNLKEKVIAALEENKKENLFGSSGSRLVSGNYKYYDRIEKNIATFYKAPAALYFKSGFEANIALIAAIGSRDAVIFYDEYIHASFRFGLQQCSARSYSFRHNDINDLDRLSKFAGDKVFVLIESVYSITGDISPMEDIAFLCTAKGWHLVLDEAHSNGLFGLNGEGLAVEKQICDKIAIRVMPFGKAAGNTGAAILCPDWFKTFLINSSMPFIYSTGTALVNLLSLDIHLEYLKRNHSGREQLFKIISQFKKKLYNFKENNKDFHHPIQAIEIENATKAYMIAHQCMKEGLMLKAMLPPTSPGNRNFLRITLHSFNSEDEIELFFENVRKLL